MVGGEEAFDKPGPYTYTWSSVLETLDGEYSKCDLSNDGLDYIVTYAMSSQEINDKYTAELRFNKYGDFISGTVGTSESYYGIEGEKTSDSFESMDNLGFEHGLLTKWPLG